MHSNPFAGGMDQRAGTMVGNVGGANPPLQVVKEASLPGFDPFTMMEKSPNPVNAAPSQVQAPADSSPFPDFMK